MMPDQNTSTSVNEPIATEPAPPQYTISNPGMINVAYTPPAPVLDEKDLWEKRQREAAAAAPAPQEFFGMMRLPPPTSTIQGTASTGACPGCGRSYTGASARSGTVARCPYCGTAMSASLGGITRPSSRVERTPADKLVERLVKNIQGTAHTSGVGQTYLPGGPRVSSTPAEDLIARGLKNSQLNWRGGQSAGVHGAMHADMRGATKTHADHLVERQIAMAHIRRNPAAVHAHVSGIVNHPASTAGVSIADPALVEYRSGGISYGAMYQSLRGRGYTDAQIAVALRMR
jgi:ribosomal protein S27E